MNSAVTDISVLFKTLITEPDSGRADAFVARSRIIVPELVYAEMGNALWTRVYNGRLAASAAVDLMEEFNSAEFQVYSNRIHIRRALEIAAAIDHPVYDCIYLALAESFNVPLVTEDRRFLNALTRAGYRSIDVKTLADVTA